MTLRRRLVLVKRLVLLMILVAVVTFLAVGAPMRAQFLPSRHVAVIWQDSSPPLKGSVTEIRIEGRCFLWFQGQPGIYGELDGGHVVDVACPTTPDPFPR